MCSTSSYDLSNLSNLCFHRKLASIVMEPGCMRSVPDLMSQLLTIDLEAKDLMYRFLVNHEQYLSFRAKKPGSFFGHEALQRGRFVEGSPHSSTTNSGHVDCQECMVKSVAAWRFAGSSENFRLNRECSSGV